MRNTLGFLFVGAMLVSTAALVGCGGDVSNSNDDMAGGSPDLATAVNPCGAATLCTLSTVADQTLTLFDNAQTTFTVSAAPDYAGDVTVSIDRTSIDNISGGKDPSVGIVVLPGVFTMAPGIPKRLDLKFNTTTDAAAFDGKTITIHIADVKDPSKSFDVPFKLTVKPVLTISLTGAGATGDLHAWSTDNLSTPLSINVRQRPVVGTGTTATGGTTFIFKNMDKNTHEIHADAPLTHQGATGTPPNGGVYQLSAVNDAKAMAAQTGGFYCHNHQGMNVMNGTRKVVFIP